MKKFRIFRSFSAVYYLPHSDKVCRNYGENMFFTIFKTGLKPWTNAKNFGMYCFSQFFTVLSQFWKWRKTYFCRIFYKLYRNGANNIPLKSYGKCETFLCWQCSLIPSCFQVILKNRDKGRTNDLAIFQITWKRHGVTENHQHEKVSHFP